MIVKASAPTRISLIGGGTDLPVFFNDYGGVVVSMAINIRQEIVLETGAEFPELEFPPGGSPSFYRTILHASGLDDKNVRLRAFFDGRIESGLGTSASAAVALVSAANRVKGREHAPDQVAQTAWDIEVNQNNLYGGMQDQIAAAYGGMNTIYFDNGNKKTPIDVRPWPDSIAKALEKRVLLFHTGEVRKNPRIQENLLVLDKKQTDSLLQIKRGAVVAIGALWSQDWEFLGDVLLSSWEWKKRSNPEVTTPKIDRIFDVAISCGAMGGKLCGSGGGGYVFFLAEPERHEALTKCLEEMGCVPVDFSIDEQGATARIL